MKSLDEILRGIPEDTDSAAIEQIYSQVLEMVADHDHDGWLRAAAAFAGPLARWFGEPRDDRRYQHAIDCCDRAIAAIPDSFQAWRLAARIYSYIWRYRDAARAFFKAYLYAPPGTIVQAYYDLTCAHAQCGALEEASRLCEEATRRRPNDVDFLRLHADVLSYLDRTAEQLELLERILAIEHNAGALADKAYCLEALGRHKKALAAWDRLLLDEPKSPRWHCSRGVTLRALGRINEALGAFREALRRKRSYWTAWKEIGRTHKLQGRPHDAEAAWDQALERINAKLASRRRLVPQRYDDKIHFLAAIGRFQEALATIDHVLARSRAARERSVEIWEKRGEILAELGRHEESLSSLERALSIRPRRSVYVEFFAPSQHLASLWNEKGLALERLNRLEDALSAFAQAALLSSLTTPVLVNRARVLKALGRAHEAAESLGQATELGLPRNLDLNKPQTLDHQRYRFIRFIP